MGAAVGRRRYGVSDLGANPLMKIVHKMFPTTNKQQVE